MLIFHTKPTPVWAMYSAEIGGLILGKIQYSGKVSLVQDFMELPPNPSEEVLVAINFVPVLQ